MTDNGLKDWYLGLLDSDKIIFLALVSAQLTIHGRAFGLDLSGEQKSRAFTGLNEIQHQVSNHIASLGMNSKRYPEDVFWNSIGEKAAYYGLSPHLSQSFSFARTRDFWARSK